jgi:hypothetical protein
MTEQRKDLEDSANALRSRLNQMEGKRDLSDLERPIHEVGVLAVRAELTKVGRKLDRLDRRHG